MLKKIANQYLMDKNPPPPEILKARAWPSKRPQPLKAEIDMGLKNPSPFC